jgi:hypothetical protein
MTTKTATPAAPVAPAAAQAAANPTPPLEAEPTSFDDVFAAITSDEGTTAQGVAASAAAAAPAGDGAPKPDPAAADASAPAGTATPGGDPPANAAETPPAPTAGTPAAPVPAQAPDAAAELAAARARIAELEAAAKPAAGAAPPAAPAGAPGKGGDAAREGATPEDKGPTWYAPTEAESTVLTKFKDEWPDIHEALQLEVKRAGYNAVQFVFHEINKKLAPKIDGLQEWADGVETQLALTQLRGSHSDYDTIVGKVRGWVDTLPGVFKNAAKTTLEGGTVEEVNELITEWRKANPNDPAAATAAAAPAAARPAAAAAPAASNVTALSDAAKKAAGKLAAVDSKRTTQTSAPDPNDFEGAWSEATATK